MLAEILSGDTRTRARLFPEAADALTAHVTVEEKHFYPAVRAHQTEGILLESLEEHLSLKRLLADLLALDVSEPAWEAKLHVLEEQLEHHHKEEETHLFPQVEKTFSRDELRELGDAMSRELEALRAARPAQRVYGETREAAPLSAPDVSALSPRA